MKTTLGDRIRLARESPELTQEQAAEHLPVTSRTLIRYEKGESEPKDFFLRSLSELTNVSLDWLKKGEGPMRDAPEGSGVDERETVRTNALRQAIAATGAEQFYLIVNAGGTQIRFPLGPPQLMGSIEMEADSASIVRENEPVTEGNPNH